MGLLNYLGGRGSSAFGEGSSRHVESDVVVGGVALEEEKSWEQGLLARTFDFRTGARVRPRLDHAICLDHGGDRLSRHLGRPRGGPPRARFLWRQGDSTAQHSDGLARVVRFSLSRPGTRAHRLRGRHDFNAERGNVENGKV